MGLAAGSAPRVGMQGAKGTRGLSTPVLEELVLISGHVSLQFEKLGYSQPWIQVPTSWVYLTGKEKSVCIKNSLCARYMHYLIVNPGPGLGGGHKI